MHTSRYARSIRHITQVTYVTYLTYVTYGGTATGGGRRRGERRAYVYVTYFTHVEQMRYVRYTPGVSAACVLRAGSAMITCKPLLDRYSTVT